MRIGPSVRCSLLGLLLATMVAACGPDGSSGDKGVELPFVIVKRDPPDADTIAAQRTAITISGMPGNLAHPEEQFYLAINRSALEKKWFLSAYIKQFSPGEVSAGTARSLGTRVVSFKIQNDKLYVFDVDDRRRQSDAFDPDALVEAYPIVKGSVPPLSKNYIVFDPAAGLNRFGMLSDAHAAGTDPDRFQVELAFSQRFRQLDDGITFEQVFTGYGEIPDPSSADVGQMNQFQASGTLALSLREYREDPNYVPRPLPKQELYFRSESRLVPNTGEVAEVPIKWPIYPGMEPIRWRISSLLEQIAGQPQFASVDLVGAVKAGVENWNQAFGFTALTAELVDPAECYAQDDQNYIIIDPDDSLGMAFANFRTNPNTGEIRGASIYFGSAWFTVLDDLLDDPAVADTSGVARAPTRWMTWGQSSSEPACQLFAQEFLRGRGLTPSTSQALTKQEKFGLYITHIILHEVGHTLGLRHNFKGSLEPPSSSVMDYVNDEGRAALSEPGAYDVAAVRYLYNLSEELPTQPFCTDGDRWADPDCNIFDHGSNPLEDDFGPTYSKKKTDTLAKPSDTKLQDGFGAALNDVLQYVRNGATTEVRQRAYWLATEGLVPPLCDATKSVTEAAELADRYTRKVFSRLYLDEPEKRGLFTNDPPEDAALEGLIIADLKGTLTNTDGVRTFETRRLTVDVLKKMQTLPALVALGEAKASISTERSGATAEQAVQIDDLLARIELAMTPYFN
jgi:hypothetical protein